jgi:hypothetical protein
MGGDEGGLDLVERQRRGVDDLGPRGAPRVSTSACGSYSSSASRVGVPPRRWEPARWVGVRRLSGVSRIMLLCARAGMRTTSGM